MSANIAFFTGAGNNQINNISGSGLGFYGTNGFGYSIPIGSYQGRSFITDSTGTLMGPEGSNIEYLTSSTAIIGQAGSGVNLLCVPNYLATLNIHFTNNSAVQTQNVKFYAYDRASTNNFPSGVTMQVAQVIHPTQTQLTNGSGNSTWTNLSSGTNVMSFIGGAGLSGLSPNGTLTSDTTHDFYANISCSPQTVGAKTFALSFSLEYL